MNSHIRHIVLPLIAAFIWGTAFVAQSIGAETLGPFAFNAMRSVVAFIVLAAGLLVYALFRRNLQAIVPRQKVKKLLIGGACCGTVLTVASYLQQTGIAYTTSGKAAFITALYIVLVPILGLFLRKRANVFVWIGVAAAVAGLYLLCVKEGFSLAMGDIYVILCALVFSVHILTVDHFAAEVNGVALSCVQFLTMTVWSAIGMLFFETVPWEQTGEFLWPVLYVGVFSSGVAYTLQIVAQKGANPTVVSLLLSLESVFGVLAGALIQDEKMLPREYIGCALMLAAVLLAQIPSKRNNKEASV